MGMLAVAKKELDVSEKASAVLSQSRRSRKSASVSRRRRKNRFSPVIKGVICLVGVLSLLGYVGIYAKATVYGYQRAELVRDIKALTMENQSLKADIVALSSPERLSRVAEGAGMAPGTQVDYIGHVDDVTVAKAD